MAHEIRKYMGDVDGEHMLGGQVEVDETLIGGVKHTGKPGPYLANKASVFGMVKRGGSVITKVIPNRSAKTLLPLIEKGIHVGTTINTDDWLGYQNIPINYTHVSVNHSKKEYVRGSVHTNTIEGFWSRVKNSIKGTHIHVSKKHLQKYLVEFEYRYNMRATPERMFERLLTSFVWVASR
jgi:transposase-like protein